MDKTLAKYAKALIEIALGNDNRSSEIAMHALGWKSDVSQISMDDYSKLSLGDRMVLFPEIIIK